MARRWLMSVALALGVLLVGGCGVSWYLGKPPSEPVLAPEASAQAPEAILTAPPARSLFGTVYDAGYVTGNGTWFYTSGAAGTVTVPSGAYVTGISCHASAGGATLTITPSGPSSQGITDAQAGPAIPIPAGDALSLAKPLLTGSASELGVGSVLVFSGTDSYLVTMFEYGGP